MVIVRDLTLSGGVFGKICLVAQTSQTREYCLVDPAPGRSVNVLVADDYGGFGRKIIFQPVPSGITIVIVRFELVHDLDVADRATNERPFDQLNHKLLIVDIIGCIHADNFRLQATLDHRKTDALVLFCGDFADEKKNLYGRLPLFVPLDFLAEQG